MKIFRFAFIFLIAGLLCGPNVIMASDDVKLMINGVQVYPPGPPQPNPCTSCASDAWGPCTNGSKTCTSLLPSGCTGSLTQSCTSPAPTCTTNLSNDVAGAVPIITPIQNHGNMWGWDNFGSGSTYGLAGVNAGTTIFLADPALIKITPGPNFGFSVKDYLQYPLQSVNVKLIDGQNCFLRNISTGGDHGWFWPNEFGYFKPGHKLLIYVTASVACNVAVTWSY